MIFACPWLPRGRYDAVTFWPIILVRPERRLDQALLAHEQVHYRRQAWITPFWLLLYWAWPSFRWHEEAMGYRAQIDAGGITVEEAADMLLTYRTGRDRAAALAALA